MTFLTGFFGLNFGWLVEHELADNLSPAGLGSLALSILALYLWLRRGGHIRGVSSVLGS